MLPKNILISEVQNSLKHVTTYKLDYLFLFYQLIFFASIITYVISDLGLICNAIISFLYFFLIKKEKFDGKFFILTILYLSLVVSLSLIFTYFNLNLIIGFYLRLLIAYFVIKIYGKEFTQFFENIVFILALISLPLFIIQISFPSIFQLFDPINFSSLTRRTAGHVNLFIYHFSTWALKRNSGFMWEPAAFGCTLAWATVINIFRNKFRINIRLIVFCVVMITTFSLGTYAYFFVLIALYFLNQKPLKGLLSIFILIILFYYLFNLSFFKERYNYMETKFNRYQHYEKMDTKKMRPGDIPRIAGFTLDLKYLIDWPIGYGFYRNRFETPNLAGSPNGLGRFLVTWGIAGAIILVLGQLKYLNNLKYQYNFQVRYSLVLVIVFLMTMYGNPIDNKPLLLVFLMYGYFFDYSFQYYIRFDKYYGFKRIH